MDELTVRTLVSGWRSAEQSLYSLGGGDVERYQRAIRMVRALADRLDDIATVEALVARWSEAERLVAEVVAEAGLPPASVVADQVAGAAFSLRHQSVVARQAHRARLDRIAAARAEGEEWVVVHESPESVADYGTPSIQVRMHLGTGLGVQRIHQPDLGAGGAESWSLEVLVLDAATGDPVADDRSADPAFAATEHATEEEARAAEADLVRRIEAADPRQHPSARVG